MDKVQEIRKALEAATPGPWKWSIKEENRDRNRDDGYDLGYLEHPYNKVSGEIILDSSKNKYGQHVVSCFSNIDAHLIANAPEWLSYLLTELDAAKHENERLRRALDKVRFYYAGTDFDNVSKFVLQTIREEAGDPNDT